MRAQTVSEGPRFRPGMLSPWRLRGQPLFLDERNFESLADQAMYAQARTSWAQDVGGWWRDGDGATGNPFPDVTFVAYQDRLTFRVEAGGFRGITAAGLPFSLTQASPVEVWGSAGERDRRAVAVLVAVDPETYVAKVVPEVVPLPLSPAIFWNHAPIAIAHHNGEGWARLDWKPRSLDSRISVAGYRADDSLLEKSEQTLASAEKLLGAIAPVNALRDLRGVLERVIDACDTVLCSSSEAQRLAAVRRAAQCLEANVSRFTLMRFSWPTWQRGTLGGIPAHFQQPLPELLTLVGSVVDTLLGSIRCDQLADDIAYDWERARELEKGAVQIMPDLGAEARHPPAPRFARVCGVSADVGQGVRLSSPSSSACDLLLLMVPDKVPAQKTTWRVSVSGGGPAFDTLVSFGPESPQLYARLKPALTEAFVNGQVEKIKLLSSDGPLPSAKALVVFEVI